MRIPSAVLLLLLALPAWGQTPRLVEDINPDPESGDSNPAGFVALGDTAVFRAMETTTGNELWRSDGTAAGTWRLTDVFQGDPSSNPVPFAVADRLVFFSAQEGPTDDAQGIWATDGTPGGTVRLTSAIRGNSALWVPAQGLIYFPADDGVHGYELWRSDGTPGGTYQVVDLLTARDPLPLELTLFRGQVWFSATGKQGGALWRSDGTAAGTVLVKNFDERSVVNYGPTHLRVVGNRLLFVAPGQNGASELWASDGTTKGTVPLTRMAQGKGDPLFFDFQAIGSRLWFVVDDGVRGEELWVTDGTPKGTRALTSFSRKHAFLPMGGEGMLPSTLTGGRLVFAADDGPHGAELWTTDGTVKGTRLLRDVCPGKCSAVVFTWRTHRGLLYWLGTDGARGLELWVTDGTAAGTRLVRDLCRGSCDATPFDLSFLADRVLFSATDGIRGRELWSTDGTAAGTVRLTDFGPVSPWYPPFQGIVTGGELLFAADDGEHGKELWRSDGTPAGTSLVLDINDFAVGGSYPAMIGALGPLAFFYATDGVHGHELWKSDGTEAGTSIVADLIPGELPIRRTADRGEEAGGRLFFGLDNELWRTDGTTAGTFPVTTGGGDGASRCCRPIRSLGGRVFFGKQNGPNGLELWTSDGTAAGTRIVKDLRPGDSEPQELTVFEGKLYFTAAGEDGYRELWRTDGTAAGTVRVAYLGVLHSGAPSRLAVHDGRLWFFADDGEHGNELWSSDGTEAGTAMAVDLEPGPRSAYPNLVVSLGTLLVVSAYDDLADGALWATDGTPEGTRVIGPVADGSTAWIVSDGRLFYNAVFPFEPPASIYVSDGTEEGTEPLPAPVGLTPALGFAPLGDRVLFTTESGHGLWITDGTEPGTVRLMTFESLGVGELLPAEERVFFPAYTPETGLEPWIVEP